ncbi:MAG: hypothetical protein ACI38A_09595 [Candidatus Ornithomonoglobus sp.]
MIIKHVKGEKPDPFKQKEHKPIGRDELVFGKRVYTNLKSGGMAPNSTYISADEKRGSYDVIWKYAGERDGLAKYIYRVPEYQNGLVTGEVIGWSNILFSPEESACISEKDITVKDIYIEVPPIGEKFGDTGRRFKGETLVLYFTPDNLKKAKELRKTKFTEYLPADLLLDAERGYKYDQYYLGVKYRDGDGVRKNYKEAAKWFRKAAEQRHADAQYELGLMYEKGIGVQQDYEEAARWYRKAAKQRNADAEQKLKSLQKKGYGIEKIPSDLLKAAKQGDADAQYKLGSMYERGDGVDEDVYEAARWYRKAAENGNADAQFEMGSMYEEGGEPLTKGDYGEASIWYRKAAEQGHTEAWKRLDFLRKNVYGINDDLLHVAEQGDADAQFNLGLIYNKSSFDVSGDYEEAAKWFRKAAEQGHAQAQYQLAKKYFYGNGVQVNKDEGIKWYRKAAEQGHLEAQCKMGYLYNCGEGVQMDKKEAARWYRKAAEQGNEDARHNLDRLRKEGYIVDKSSIPAELLLAAERGNAGAQFKVGCLCRRDYEEVAKWYKKAAEQGHAQAQYKLGYMYDCGFGVQKDEKETEKWYRKAAEQGHAGAQHKLGRIYVSGYGVQVNKDEGIKWYRKAAEHEITDAQNNLRCIYCGEVKNMYKEEFELYKREIAEAQWFMGCSYLKGDGVRKNKAEAEKWLTLAYENGIKVAKSVLDGNLKI